MEKATAIPLDNCGLTISCGSDGTWLNFKSADGKLASINIDVHAENKSHIIGAALKGWSADRQKQAEQIRASQKVGL